MVTAMAPAAHVRSLLRFRTGCHGLPRDLGSRAQVPRSQRLCTLCHDGPGDYLECTALSVVRAEYTSRLTFHGTLREFMWLNHTPHVASSVHRLLEYFVT